MWKVLKKLFLKNVQEEPVTDSTHDSKKSEVNGKGFSYEDDDSFDWYDSSFDRKDALKKRLDYMERRHGRGMW